MTSDLLKSDQLTKVKGDVPLGAQGGAYLAKADQMQSHIELECWKSCRRHTENH